MSIIMCAARQAAGASKPFSNTAHTTGGKAHGLCTLHVRAAVAPQFPVCACPASYALLWYQPATLTHTFLQQQAGKLASLQQQTQMLPLPVVFPCRTPRSVWFWRAHPHLPRQCLR
jgi:hypothetical protein